jgi:hypothetical protein
VRSSHFEGWKIRRLVESRQIPSWRALGQCDLPAGQAMFGVLAALLRIPQNQAGDIG